MWSQVVPRWAFRLLSVQLCQKAHPSCFKKRKWCSTIKSTVKSNAGKFPMTCPVASAPAPLRGANPWVTSLMSHIKPNIKPICFGRTHAYFFDTMEVLFDRTGKGVCAF